MLLETDIESFLRPDLGQRAVRSRVARPAGAILARFSESRIVPAPSRITVQLDQGVHLELTPSWLELVNHRCEPNVAFDMDLLALVSLRPIHPGDELTYFYPSTEWVLDEPFVCRCAATCIGRVTGARDLPRSVLQRHRLSPLVRRAMEAREQHPAEETTGASPGR